MVSQNLGRGLEREMCGKPSFDSSREGKQKMPRLKRKFELNRLT
jgi:hypothetical protein